MKTRDVKAKVKIATKECEVKFISDICERGELLI